VEVEEDMPDIQGTLFLEGEEAEEEAEEEDRKEDTDNHQYNRIYSLWGNHPL